MRFRKQVLAAVMPLALLVTCAGPVSDRGPDRHAAPQRGPAAPRPAIVSRSAWHADEKSVHGSSAYTGGVRAVFVHHTDMPNDYDCADVPAMLRELQAAHIDRGWDDIGYNYVVDRCGTIYEGRQGGTRRPLKGAHTKGFNAHSIGVAALGTFDRGQPVPQAVLHAMAELAAWKLRPEADPRGTVRLVSSSDDSRYEKGDDARLHVISGHRDADETMCPGQALYDALPRLREMTARLRAEHDRRRGPHARHRAAPAGR